MAAEEHGSLRARAISAAGVNKTVVDAGGSGSSGEETWKDFVFLAYSK